MLAPPPAAHFFVSDRPEILPEIRTPGVNLCIWERGSRPEWVLAIQAILAHREALDLDMSAPSEERVADLIGSSLGPNAIGESVAALAADVSDLASRYADIAGIRHPRVRLSRVEGDGCALFHADTLSLRLLCTYAGPGTQWLENDNVRRNQLGSNGRSNEDATDAIVIDPNEIRTVPTSHVALFKGRLADGEEHNALVHRSAPVRGVKDFRLRLCIDQACTC